MISPNGRLILHDTKMFYNPMELGNNVEGAIVKFARDNPEWAFVEHQTNECGLGELINMKSDIFSTIKNDEKYHNWKELSFEPINSKY